MPRGIPDRLAVRRFRLPPLLSFPAVTGGETACWADAGADGKDDTETATPFHVTARVRRTSEAAGHLFSFLIGERPGRRSANLAGNLSPRLLDASAHHVDVPVAGSSDLPLILHLIDLL